MIGLFVMALGWLCLSVGVVVSFGLIFLIPIGVLTLAAGYLLDLEVTAHGKRP